MYKWSNSTPRRAYCGILNPHPYAMLLVIGSLYLSHGSIVARTFSFM